MTAFTRSLAGLVCCSLAAGGLTAVGVAALRPQTAEASSHREAPLISGQPQYDATDVYAFQSPDKPDRTTLITNFLPFQDPAGGPNFYKFGTDARYDLHIDNDGDGQGDLLFRWTFKDHLKNGDTFLYNTGPVDSLDDPDLNFTQSYDLEVFKLKNQRAVARAKLADDLPVAPSNVGKASMPDYKKLRDQAVQEIGYSGGSTSFAGQADDPFFADLRVFDLLYGGDMSEIGNDTLKGYNVQSLALEVPTKALVESKDQPVIGVWSTVHRKTARGGWAQVSRLGNPLVNEVVIPRKDKDKFNASAPWDDAQFAGSVKDPELPKLIEQIYKIEAPDTPRDDLVQVFLTGVPKLNQPPHVRPSEMLRLNTSVAPAKDPKRLGVLDGDNAGFPNGRRPLDDVLDISLQAVEGELLGKKNDLGDAVDKNDQEFYGAFPFLALPSSGSDAKAVSKSAGSSLLEGGSGLGGSSEDTMMLAGSAAAGGGAVLLLGLGLLWMRKSRRPARARRR
ncbi:DUF4331 domain-containing protein [Streptomyces sp. NBRC 110028]|uniref:DUF4331 domain-containing protein n=1 Tax=Streptomyces sp. NBRC 110028 TaxID=1621260 RepID=UPI0006E299AB|nr:DUF4331 domain-containing protein [Streptomyces sp. NBRC 110028]